MLFGWSSFLFLSYNLCAQITGWKKWMTVVKQNQDFCQSINWDRVSLFLKDLTSNALKQRNNTDLCLNEDKRNAGRRCVNHGIDSKKMKNCSAACCTSKESFFSISNIWKGRRDTVIALAVISSLSSFWPAPVNCGKGASNLMIYLLTQTNKSLLLLPINRINSFTALLASWKLLSELYFHAFTSVNITRKRIPRDVRITNSLAPCRV